MKFKFSLTKIEKALQFSAFSICAVSAAIFMLNIGKQASKNTSQPSVFGIGDTTQTWQFSAATAADYTHGSDIVIDNSGARVAANQTLLQNSTLETNSTGWTFALHAADANAQAYLSAMSVPSSEGRRAIDNKFVADLKSNNIWTNLDEIWVFAQETQQAGLLGLKRNVDASNVGSTPFTANQGFQRDSGSKYINTNFAPGTNGVNYTNNNASFGFYTDTDAAQSAYDMSTANSGEAQTSYITARWGDGIAYERVNHNGTAGGVAVANSNGFFVARRPSSTQEILMKDGAIIINRTTSSAGLSNFPFAVGARNVSGAIDSYTTRRYKLAFVGSSMSDGEQVSFNTLVSNYLTTVAGAYDPTLLEHSASTTYNSSAGAASIYAYLSDHDFYQSYNVGNTEQYLLIAYAYTDGSAVNSSDIELFYNGNAIATDFTSVGAGWYRLSSTITGANASRSFGVQVKAGNTVYVDNILLYKKTGYSLYTTQAYENTSLIRWENASASESVPAGSALRYQLCDQDGADCESGQTWKYWNGSAWATASNLSSHSNTIAELTDTAIESFPSSSKQISLKVIFDLSAEATPQITAFNIGLSTDTTSPTSNASSIQMQNVASGNNVPAGEWANNPAVYFSWTAGADNPGGSGLRGYCLYLGQDPDADPTASKGLLGISPVSTAGTTCGFIVGTNEIDFATAALRGTPWLVSDTLPYYLNIKAVDNVGMVYTGASASFEFDYDDTTPTNVTYISPASGTFNGIADMNFSWPTNGAAASSDNTSGLLGWQYAINNTTTWLGTQTHASLGVDYIPVGYVQPHHFTQLADGPYVVVGDNVVYFRTIDVAGNYSSTSTYRTGNLAYGGNAPAFAGDASVTISPSTNTSNSFALSWPAAIPTSGNSIDSYYYMINTVAPATLATLTGNSATYIPTSQLSVPAGLLAGAQKGSNQVRVVAVDNEGNYSPSNSIVGNFTLNSSNPDPATNLTVSDASIKAANLWRAALAWDPPAYQGTGVLTYHVQRSSNGSTWTEVGTTGGTAYVDTVGQSQQYYWRIGTVDTSDDSINSPSYTNAVTLTPRGAYTEPAALTSGPQIVDVTTRQAEISWSTSRNSDSKIAFGTVSGEYNPEEIANSSQTTAHSVKIRNLLPGVTYYYVAKWTDEDGNTGVSSEQTFTTDPAPSVNNVRVSGVNLSSATITYSVTGATAVKIYYGPTNAFGGLIETLTSSSKATYSSTITGLQDGQNYLFKVNPVDSENTEYQGTVLDFTTLPRPRVTNIQISQLQDTAQPAIAVSWQSNTEVSSIVSYYPEGHQEQAKDVVDLLLITGEHEMTIESLLPETTYQLVVKGQDINGNQAVSDIYRFTTASDTRPPRIYDLKIEGGAALSNSSLTQNAQTQLIVSWKTDEPATSQVEFGEGTGNSYPQSTQREENLKTTHLVVISGLSPSKVYHLRVISEDSASNIARSDDNSVITPKAPDSALYLVFRNLLDIFGFLN